MAFVRKRIEVIQYVCGGFGILLNDELEMEHKKLCMLVFFGMRLYSICGTCFSLSFQSR